MGNSAIKTAGFKPGDVVEGKYRIVSLLAEGGMGAVYRAVQDPLGRNVALKTLKADDDPREREIGSKRFFREAALCSRLNHPNTVIIYDYGQLQDVDSFFLVMEYLEGVSLRDFLLNQSRVNSTLTLHIAIQIANSLADAHRSGVVHRDLKPPNIMLVRRGEDPHFVKVVDFGLVKDLNQRDEQLTTEHTVIGSPLYMAPERYLYENADSPKADIYSLGIILYEMLTGKPPFQRASDSTIHHLLNQHVHQAPPPMRSIVPDLYLPRGLEEIVMSCLVKKPEERMESMDVLSKHLNSCLRDETGQSLSGNFPLATPPKSSGFFPVGTANLEVDATQPSPMAEKTLISPQSKPFPGPGMGSGQFQISPGSGQFSTGPGSGQFQISPGSGQFPIGPGSGQFQTNSARIQTSQGSGQFQTNPGSVVQSTFGNGGQSVAMPSTVSAASKGQKESETARNILPHLVAIGMLAVVILGMFAQWVFAIGALLLVGGIAFIIWRNRDPEKGVSFKPKELIQQAQDAAKSEAKAHSLPTYNKAVQQLEQGNLQAALTLFKAVHMSGGFAEETNRHLEPTLYINMTVCAGLLGWLREAEEFRQTARSKLGAGRESEMLVPEVLLALRAGHIQVALDLAKKGWMPAQASLEAPTMRTLRVLLAYAMEQSAQSQSPDFQALLQGALPSAGARPGEYDYLGKDWPEVRGFLVRYGLTQG